MAKPTAQQAKDILNSKIETGRASALAAFEKIFSEVPADTVVKGAALSFNPEPVAGVGVSFKGSDLKVHRHALSQLAQRAGVPGQYLATLAESPDQWQRELAAHTLARHYGNGEASSRFLVRAVNGEARGFLSDKYRRLDSRPLIEAFATEVKTLGAVPIEGVFSDTRVSMKAILPTLHEPVEGEVLALGLEWFNSDYGHGAHAVRAFIWRAWCDNGATLENALAQVHLGRTLSDDIELSQRTYELDTKTSISALRDVVRGTLAPKKVAALLDGIKRADEEKVEWRNISSKVAKRLLKGELEKARDAFEGNDVYNLPAGKSVWRASNALSWIAGQTENPDRKLELQRLAGEIMGAKDREVAEAA